MKKDKVPPENPTKPGPFDPDPPQAAEAKPASKSVLKVRTLDEILSYVPPPGSELVGDGVLQAGGISMLFGPPGSFKGFAIGQLMACGARGSGDWLGFEVRERFGSLWINCENTPGRLLKQFKAMNLPPDARDYIFPTDIPDVWSFNDPTFVREVRETIVARNIKLVIIDTVSCFAADEMAKDFAAFFASLHTALLNLPWQVAVLIIHHKRKPKDGDRSARGLLHSISGHQTLQRRSRCIIYLGRVTEKMKEKIAVAACLKCSDSPDEEGKMMAVKLNAHNELEEVPDYDLSEWEDGGEGEKSGPAVTLAHLREIFANGDRWLSLTEAKDELTRVAGVGRATAYKYLKLDGPHGKWLRWDTTIKKMTIRKELSEGENGEE